jgi:hypothetical protein
MDYPHFSEFGEKGPLEGEKTQLQQILDKEILVTDFRIQKSRFKDDNYITIQFLRDDKKFVVFTGSEVLRDQLQRNQSKLPFYTTVIKKYKYFCLS